MRPWWDGQCPINAFLGLPSPSGNNHLVLNDYLALFADDFSETDQARDLLAAFKASVGVPPAPPSGSPGSCTPSGPDTRSLAAGQLAGKSVAAMIRRPHP